MPSRSAGSPVFQFVERIGRGTTRGVEGVGYCATLIAESLYWLFAGPWRNQPVRLGAVVAEMMRIGIHAIPIIAMMAATIGVMLAIQGIHTLKIFGAQSQVVIGIALSVTREFAPLITGILVAGRSGSALAARLGTMGINQEIDALRVMGINPVRYLVVPDDQATIEQTLMAWADDDHLDLILTTGGTGLSDRDVMPEATQAVIERLAPGLAEAMRAHGMTKTPMAMLSRGMAGARGKTLIVNLPGSPKGVREGVEVLLPVLPHALGQLTGADRGH